MSAWESLQATAVQGSLRRPPDRAQWMSALGEAAVGLDADDSAAVLQAAALLSVGRRAGANPQFRPVDGDPAPADPRPMVPREAFDLLDESGPGYESARDELLAQVAARDLQVPAQLAPGLLAAARRRRAIRADVLAGLGPRGRWLAARNPEWAPLLRPVAPQGTNGRINDKVWREGDSVRRLTWLRRVREQNPEAAFDYVAAALADAREPIEVREGIIDILASHDPFPGEEDLLEACLDARAKGVRRGAARTLAAWPESALSGRMAVRAGQWVRFDVSLTRHRIVVSVPDELDESAIRDGLGQTDPTTGPRQGTLAEVLSHQPLSFWDPLGTPEQAVTTVMASEWSSALTTALLARVKAERNREWADALLPVIDIHLRAGLARVCSPSARDEQSLWFLGQPPRNTAAAANRWFEVVPFPLSAEVCTAAVQAMPSLGLQTLSQHGNQLAQHLARRIGAEQPPQWYRALDQIAPLMAGFAGREVANAAELMRRRARVRTLVEQTATAPENQNEPAHPDHQPEGDPQ